IPGFIEIEIPNWLRAGGALAVFVVVYFYNPASLVAPPAEKLSTTTMTGAPDPRTNENSRGTINITGNTGNTQVSINSPGSQQVINQKRVIRREVTREKMRRGSLHVLRLTFRQTDGIWGAGEKFWLQLELSGPYQDYRFISGYPPTLPLSDVRTTHGVAEAASKGWIELETATPPINEPIILEIESESELDVRQILLKPTDG
ncbi:MAG: hypothetical protein ACREQA_14690, partial [Candidatus Binatia bacterium]